LAEVTLGLEHLHARGFIHRDLKVENIMLDAVGHVKIIDFGLACQIIGDTQPVSPTGSLSYMAPEMIHRGKRTGGRHTDWWAMGVLAYEVLTARSPWSTLTDRQVIKHEIENCAVKLPMGCPATKWFVEGLIERDVGKRLGTARDSDVKAAQFFRTVDWGAMERGETDPAFLLRECGPAIVDKAESKKALAAYLENAPTGSAAASSFTEVGKFGVKSPWFLGVDVVRSGPGIAGHN